MLKKLLFIYRYFLHRLKSVDEHGIHSPFVFYLLTNVIYVKNNYYPFKNIEKLREKLLTSKVKINCNDMGAGSVNTSKKTIGNIAKHSAKSPQQAQLLFRLVNFFQPSEIIELGTSLGISAAYMASANTKTQIFTIDGCEDIAEISKQNFKQLKLKNIEQITGNFDEAFPKLLKNRKQLEFVFIDGNHQKLPTINYFKQCLEKVNENTVLIFDDIYWSDEMMEAWQEIKNSDKVSVTVDLFFMGIVFFRKEQAKQHFLIRF